MNLAAIFRTLWALFAPAAPAAPVAPSSPPSADVAPAPVQGLAAPAAFYAAVRAGSLLGPVIAQSEVDGCNAITQACGGLPLSWAAYSLATAYLETAHTMQPIREMGGEAYFFRMYDPQGNRPAVAAQLGNTQPGDGARFCGRGYVQLTGRADYARAGRLLGMDLIGNPDLALRPDIAAKIMRQGMVGGWFTGKSFADFLTPTAGRDQFINARRIINGTDRAPLIADFAVQFQDALRVGGWP